MVPQLAEPSCRGVQPLAEAGASPAEGASSERSIRWYAPDSPDMRRALDRWCATVGPAVIRPDPAPQLAGTASAGPLNVVAWNAAVGGGDLLAFLDGELDLSCTDGAPRPGPDFSHFALLVQEAHRLSEDVPETEPGAPRPKQIDPGPRPGPLLDITEVGARCGLALVYVPSARNGKRAEGERREDKGNAILASLPLDDFVAIEVPLEASRKVAVGARLELPDGGPLRVFSIHFDVSASLSRVLISGNSWRLDQAAALDQAIDRAATAAGETPGERGTATLVAGDFNVWSADNSALRLFRREYPESPEWTGQGTRGAFPTDHLFFAEGRDGRVRLLPGSFRRIEERYYSDHNAVSVQVTTER
jgi:endonuclease/exonuclease/phosphatase family metal-dependent hydrolase